jgi:hypothetical protein
MWLGGLCGLAGLIQAQTSTNPAPVQTRTIELSFQETASSIIRGWLPSDRASVTFKKEPALGQSALRGRLRFGTDTNQFVPFAWEPTRGKLYLDLNRNLDLTDDPEGTFTSAATPNHQVFTNVHFTLNTAAGPRPFLVDLHLDNSNGRYSASVDVRSFWQAKVELQGREWQMGIMEKPFERRYPDTPGDWLLRPWAARQQPLSMTGAGTPDLVNYCSRLFLQSQAYKATCRYDMQDGKPKCTLALTEEQPELGELKLSGEFLHRLILADPAGYTVVVDAPGPLVRIPLGTYKSREIWVRRQGGEAGHFSDGLVRITKEGVASLPAGGPLTNTVALTRRGRNLTLDYQLKGAGGILFRLNQKEGDGRPEYAIYHGGKKLQTGKFEFG